MAIIDLTMPKLGESIMEATILKWHKKVGDTVLVDEVVLDIATDKVDSEVPSIAEGVITEILYKENDTVAIDSTIAKIKTEENDTPEAATEVVSDKNDSEVSSTNTAGKFYSPLVLNIANRENIPLSELEHIEGTGSDGRVTKNDLLKYISARGKTTTPQQPANTAGDEKYVVPASKSAATIPSAGNTEIVEMGRMRKLIAEHMVRSVHTSPHVTSFSEADVTNMVLWREKVKKDFEKREGIKITFVPLFINALVKCIKQFPLINSSVEGDDRIIIKKDINIGMATALPDGNLIVPVIKNADQLNIVGLSKQVNYLANAARNGKLKADDTQGGTFTLTNVGTFGNLTGTPIINQPQSAILAVGVIKKRPVVIETEHGDSIAIRHMMYVSMSYDHRIIDGSLGASFVTAFTKELENFQPVLF